jgi:hypothetical protein
MTGNGSQAWEHICQNCQLALIGPALCTSPRHSYGWRMNCDRCGCLTICSACYCERKPLAPVSGSALKEGNPQQ